MTSSWIGGNKWHNKATMMRGGGGDSIAIKKRGGPYKAIMKRGRRRKLQGHPGVGEQEDFTMAS